MKSSPKLLPWLARKAGLPLEKAEALWRSTFANESITVQCAGNPDLFYRRVLECFQQHAALESTSRTPARAALLQAAPAKSKRADSDAIGPGFAIA